MAKSDMPVIDPTANVKELVAAEARRQDDLRQMADTHTREMIGVNEHHARELREAEARRIDAIRAVDVAAVQRAAEVAATQAEALRNQVAVTANAQSASLDAALQPIKTDIQDLRRVQYETQGQKTQVVDWRQWAGVLIAGAVAIYAFRNGG